MELKHPNRKNARKNKQGCSCSMCKPWKHKWKHKFKRNYRAKLRDSENTMEVE